VVIGDYVFVHAGIRPGVPLEAQDDEDLCWIREPFLSSTADHGKVVVHGHTIAPAPELRRNRIGIDTGAFATGVLTCVVLEEDRQRFLST
jgi:serine/threonine protein phosphatase 1